MEMSIYERIFNFCSTNSTSLLVFLSIAYHRGALGLFVVLCEAMLKSGLRIRPVLSLESDSEFVDIERETAAAI